MKLKIFNWKNEKEQFFYNSINSKYKIKYYKLIKMKPTLHFIDYQLAKKNFYNHIRFSNKNWEKLIILEINKLFQIDYCKNEIINEYLEIVKKTWLKGFESENKFVKFLSPEYKIEKSLYLDKIGIDFKIYDPYTKQYWYIQIKNRLKLDPWYKNYFSSNRKNYLLLKYIHKFDTFKVVN